MKQTAAMKNRFSQIALFSGMILLLGGLVIRVVKPTSGWIAAALVVIGVILAGYAGYQYVGQRRERFSKRALQYGANTTLVTVVFLGIVGMLAFLTTRHHLRKDLTEKHLFSLAPQTVSLLKKLDHPVHIVAFYKSGDEDRARRMLENYAYHTKQIRFEFVDPIENPVLAKQYGDVDYGNIFVESGKNRVKLNGKELSESKLTNAILKVTRSVQKTIYFLTGHGEHDIASDETDAAGYRKFAEGLRNENFAVKSLNLATDRQIPKDCSALLIAGPSTDLLPFEQDSIRSYLKHGGRVGVFVDPGVKKGWVKLLRRYHVRVGDNLILDASGLGQLYGMGPQVVLVSKYEDHPIFHEFDVTTYFPEACSVMPDSDAGDSVTTQVLFRSLPGTWAERDYNREPLSFEKGVDIEGPVPVATVVTVKVDSTRKARLLVVGDSDFATNQHIGNAGNYDLALNMVNWLAEQEDMITIRPKEIEDRRIALTQQDSVLMLLLSVFILPVVIVVIGVTVYFKRKK